MLKLSVSFGLVLLFAIQSELFAQSNVPSGSKDIKTAAANEANKFKKTLQLSDQQRNKVYNYLVSAYQKAAVQNGGSATASVEGYFKNRKGLDSFCKTVFTEQQYMKYENRQRVDAVDKE